MSEDFIFNKILIQMIHCVNQLQLLLRSPLSSLYYKGGEVISRIDFNALYSSLRLLTLKDSLSYLQLETFASH